MGKTKRPTDFLSELEQNKLQTLADDEIMLEAIKKILFDGILNQGVQRSNEASLQNRNWVFGLDQTGTMSDDEFGRAVRVRAEALVLVERSFSEILTLKLREEKQETVNPAL